MIPKECKRLAEVDFPIAAVGAAVLSREKKFPVPRGLPSTMHQWWARRPLGSCRAILLALLLPDPCDNQCPDSFKEKARTILAKILGDFDPDDKGLRDALLKFIGNFAHWDLSSNAQYLESSRSLVDLVQRGDKPLVADPFAGGGAIPLEALRIGCDTYASDLNPVACLIEKVLIQTIPRYGPGLLDAVDKYSSSLLDQSVKAVAKFYPRDRDGKQPVAYFWARTVRCEAPKCGAEIPIFREPWLSKKRTKDAIYFKEDAAGDCVAILIKDSPLGGPLTLCVAQGFGSSTVQPGFRALTATKAPGNNNNVVCPCCGTTMPGNRKSPRVPAQLINQHGGVDVIFDEQGRKCGGATLLAVMTEGQGGERRFRSPQEDDYLAILHAQKLCDEESDRLPNERINPIRPSPNARGLSAVTRYGMLYPPNILKVVKHFLSPAPLAVVQFPKRRVVRVKRRRWDRQRSRCGSDGSHRWQPAPPERPGAGRV